MESSDKVTDKVDKHKRFIHKIRPNVENLHRQRKMNNKMLSRDLRNKIGRLHKVRHPHIHKISRTHHDEPPNGPQGNKPLLSTLPVKRKVQLPPNVKLNETLNIKE